MAQLTGAHLLIRALKAEGIDTIFTLVGDFILPLCDAAVDEGIRFVDTRHEAAAVHMADAYTRVTGRPAVVMVTGGPGHTNAMAGVPMSYLAETPVMFISGSPETYLRGMGAMQEIPQVEMTSPVTKGAWQIPHIRRINEFVGRAFRTALGGRPGPVYLSVPMDVQEEAASEEDLRPYQPQGRRPQGRQHADPHEVAQAIRLLQSAQRPAVIAGAASWFSLPSQTLREFIETTQAPLFTMELCRGLVSDDHPLCFGYADRALNDAFKMVSQADLVLLLGKKMDLRIGYGGPPHISSTARVVQVEPAPDEIGTNRPVDLGIVGDIGTVVGQLTQEAKQHRWRDLPWVGELRQARQQARQQMDDLASREEPIHPLHIAQAVEKALPEDAILVNGGGDYVQWARAYLPARRPGGWLRLGPLGQLGAELPFSLGCRVADPRSPIVVTAGDGSLGFYLAELDTAVRHNLPVTIVLGNDSRWGIDQEFQLAYYGRTVGTDLRFVRYDRIVEEFGGHGEFVERLEDLSAALGRAMSSGKLALVNVVMRGIRSPLADGMIAAKKTRRTGPPAL